MLLHDWHEFGHFQFEYLSLDVLAQGPDTSVVFAQDVSWNLYFLSEHALPYAAALRVYRVVQCETLHGKWQIKSCHSAVLHPLVMSSLAFVQSPCIAVATPPQTESGLSLHSLAPTRTDYCAPSARWSNLLTHSRRYCGELWCTTHPLQSPEQGIDGIVRIGLKRASTPTSATANQ